MNRILILYGTTDGHTEKIGRFLQDELRARGAIVDLCNAATDDPYPADYAGIVVAASVHASGYQRAVVRWARAHASELRPRHTAFLSVCLGILQKSAGIVAQLSTIRNRFIGRTGWTPDQFRIVAGALPYTRYGWWKRRVMLGIARKAGATTDISRDHEFTDWNELRAFASDFCALCLSLPPIRVDLHTLLRPTTHDARGSGIRPSWSAGRHVRAKPARPTVYHSDFDGARWQ